jgi:hypothetical protein
MVEQLTLNQLVEGSSPSRCTKLITPSNEDFGGVLTFRNSDLQPNLEPFEEAALRGVNPEGT